MKKSFLFSGLLVVFALLAFAFVPMMGGCGSSKTKSATTEDSVASGGEQGLKFAEPNWNKALAQAKKENKLVFLDAYASWCGPCKLLKRNTFPDKAAGEFFNKNFINVAIDMEKGEGPALAAKYAVSAYPTLIITDASGNLVTYARGYIDAAQLIEFGKHGLVKSGK